MARAGLDVGLDIRTMKLIKLAQALRLSEALPVTSGRKLEQLAKAARLFAEAGADVLATQALDEMTAMFAGVDEPGMDEVREAVDRAIGQVLATLGRAGVERALQDAEFRGVPGRAA